MIGKPEQLAMLPAFCCSAASAYAWHAACFGKLLTRVCAATALALRRHLPLDKQVQLAPAATTAAAAAYRSPVHSSSEVRDTQTLG